jgi:hypothetical protein
MAESASLSDFVNYLTFSIFVLLLPAILSRNPELSHRPIFFWSRFEPTFGYLQWLAFENVFIHRDQT